MHTVLDVVRQGEEVEGVLSGRFIVHFHIVIYGLFVAEVKVVFHMITSNQIVMGVIFFLFFFFFDLFASYVLLGSVRIFRC